MANTDERADIIYKDQEHAKVSESIASSKGQRQLYQS